MTIEITYINGNTITDRINHLHFEDGKIHYTVDSQVHNVIQDIVAIPIENIAKYDVTNE